MPEEPESLIVQYRSAAVSVASPDDSVIRSSSMVKATSSAAAAEAGSHSAARLARRTASARTRHGRADDHD